MNKTGYFLRAESWAVDNQQASARAQRVAWIIAGAAVGVAMLEAVALALLTPLKTVQPITLLVDRQTGYVEALDPVHPKRIAADDALLQALLAQYVSAREGFDRATISADYRRVAMWSGGRARQSYLSQIPASNPASPFKKYLPGTVIVARVTSVSQISPGTAFVRFDTLRQDSSSGTTSEEPWIAVVRYRFVDAPMQFEDRIINPLGFQVTDYRRDPEAPRPITVEDDAPGQPNNAAAGGGSVSDGSPDVRAIIRSSSAVSANQIPMGSPLDPGISRNRVEESR